MPTTKLSLLVEASETLLSATTATTQHSPRTASASVNRARSTLAHWVWRYGVALQPLVDRLREIRKTRVVLQADEIPVQQLAPGKGKTERAYLWAYCSNALDEHGQLDGPDPPPPIVVFDNQPGRAGARARLSQGLVEAPDGR